jgi:dihydroneopterin triphosphate diphosphatase
MHLLERQSLTLSDKHDEFRWLAYEQAQDLLKWDSNKTAIWELNERLVGPRNA